jgi:hypothetical protein
MGTLRTKVLAAFLAGMVCTLGVLTVREWVDRVERHINAIEQYLESHPIPQLMMPDSAPQSHKESHKGELSKPQQWKV